MANFSDVEHCYRYILGREMNLEERGGAMASLQTLEPIGLPDLRRTFLQSAEFHHSHLETLFENLVPKSTIVAHETALGFRIYLDLRQLHLSFGILSGFYERQEIEILRKIVPDQGTFLDVGANVGYFSLAIASRPGFRGRVFSFEPLLPLFSLLDRAITENDLQNRVMARQIALAEKPGTMALTDAEHTINAGSTRLTRGNGADAMNNRIVTVETLDRIAGDFQPDVIKVDIEGAEGLFFHGGMKTIKQHRPTILFEVNVELLRLVSGIGPAEIHRWLSQNGYVLWAVRPDHLAPLKTGQDLNAIISGADITNVLAVHSDRTDDVRLRLGELP